MLLADELNRCKGKENHKVEKNIRMIQNTYQGTHQDTLQLMIVDKGKQKKDRVQDEEVFLYKPYDVSLKSSRSKTSEPKFIQDEINNLEKTMLLLQSLIKTMPFYSPPHYKSLQPNGEQNK